MNRGKGAKDSKGGGADREKRDASIEEQRQQRNEKFRPCGSGRAGKRRERKSKEKGKSDNAHVNGIKGDRVR